jgi:hypothetical protein
MEGEKRRGKGFVATIEYVMLIFESYLLFISLQAFGGIYLYNLLWRNSRLLSVITCLLQSIPILSVRCRREITKGSLN